MLLLAKKRIFSIFALFAFVFINLKEIVASNSQNSYKNSNTNKDNTRNIAEWTIAIYMGARNNLASYAASNLQEMATATRNSSINVVAQWDQFGKKGAWRYSAKNGIVNLEQYTSVDDPINVGSKLINFINWSLQTYPCKKLAIIFWNHGSGPITPGYSDSLRLFLQNREMSDTTDENFLKNIFIHNNSAETIKQKDRAVLFDDEYKTYLSNSDMRNVLLQLTGPNYFNKKIDLVGFDACYMSATEIAYQLRDCASIMVGSEEIELAKGWNYTYWLTRLSLNPQKSAKEVATDIAMGFEDFYKHKTQLYTQSVIDLCKIDGLKHANDCLIAAFDDCLRFFNRRLLSAVIKARRSCIQFSAKFYIDLHSFCKNMIVKVLAEDGIAPLKELQTDPNLLSYDEKYLTARSYHPSVVQLVTKTKMVMRILETAVLKNCKSNMFLEAGGLSIYFPCSRNIDPSYLENDFVNVTQWGRFIQSVYTAQ